MSCQIVQKKPAPRSLSPAKPGEGETVARESFSRSAEGEIQRGDVETHRVLFLA